MKEKYLRKQESAQENETLGRRGLHLNADQTEYMCFNQIDISILTGDSLKLLDKFNYLESSV